MDISTTYFIFPLITLSIGLMWLVYHWPRGGVHETFSHHAASSCYATHYYAILFLITLPFLVYWYGVYFMPSHLVPIWTVWLFVIGCGFQILAAIVPEKGVTVRPHRILTGLSIASIYALSLYLTYINASSRLFWLMLMSGILLYVAIRGQQTPHKLWVQVGFYASFFALLVV